MMRSAVHRLTAPLLAKIPDYSGDPVRRQAAIGLTASIVIHLLLFCFIGVAVWLMPHQSGYENGSDKPLEIEIVPPKEKPETERLTLDDKTAREMLLSRGMKASLEKPKNVDFESDQDMKAGSDLPATGLLPLPSQEGRTDIPSMDFEKQDIIIGATENAAESIVQAPKGNEPPRPIYKPQPVTNAQLSAANQADANTALPQVAATPPPRFEERLRPSTPPPLRNVPVPGEGELAIATVKPATPPPVRPKVADSPVAPVTRQPMEMASLTTPAPPPTSSSTKKFRENMEKARIEGSISERGAKAVNAVGTPLGKYMKGVSSLIGSRWQILVDSKREWLSVGSVRLKFTILPSGKIESIAIEANDSNRNFADVCVQAVQESKLDPLPPEATEQLRDGRLEVPFTFTLYSTH